MTNAQRLAVRASEIRERLNELAGKDELSDEERSEMDTLTAEYRDVESRHRAAIVAESDGLAADAGGPSDADAGDDDQPWDLMNRVSLASYLGTAAEGRALGGAERELNQELGLADEVTPLAALLDPVDLESRAAGHGWESRADAATPAPSTVGTVQASIAGRVFARTAAAFCGVMMPDVPAGERTYPVLSAGHAPAAVAAGATHESSAATFEPHNLAPKRITGKYTFQIEDAASFAGLEAALRADLRGALGEQLDNQVLNRPTAPKGLFGGALGTDPDDPGAASVLTNYVDEVSAYVDGRYALTLQDVRMLLGAATYSHLQQVIAGAAGGAASELFDSKLGAYRVSALVPAPASNIQKNLVCRGTGGAVAPIWQNVMLIRDPYSKAAAGQVDITAHTLYGFATLRTDQFKIWKSKSA